MLLTESRVYKSMPVKLGCTGLCSAAHHSPAAFIASSRPKLRPSLTPFFWLQSPDAPPTGSSLLRQQSGNAAYSSAELLPPNSTQHSLSREFDAHLHALLSNIASVREKACFLSLALPHAGDWIDAPPSTFLNLNSRSFGAAMAYRLGLKLLTAGECRAENCSRNSRTNLAITLYTAATTTVYPECAPDYD